MSGEVSTIKIFFEAKHIFLSIPWIESFLEWFKQENPDYTEKYLFENAYEQWLLQDLRSIEICVLPPNISSKKLLTINGIYCLQILEIVDISKPKLWQLQKIHNTMSDNITYESFSSNRLLQILLTDGIQEVKAIEFHHITCLSLDLPPGTKMKLIGPVKVRRGVIMLESKNINVLGGEVEELKYTNSVEKVLEEKLNISVSLQNKSIQQRPKENVNSNTYKNVLVKNNPVVQYSNKNLQNAHISNCTYQNEIVQHQGCKNVQHQNFGETNKTSPAAKSNIDLFPSDEFEIDEDLLLAAQKKLIANNVVIDVNKPTMSSSYPNAKASVNNDSSSLFQDVELDDSILAQLTTPDLDLLTSELLDNDFNKIESDSRNANLINNQETSLLDLPKPTSNSYGQYTNIKDTCPIVMTKECFEQLDKNKTSGHSPQNLKTRTIQYINSYSEYENTKNDKSLDMPKKSFEQLNKNKSSIDSPQNLETNYCSFKSAEINRVPNIPKVNACNFKQIQISKVLPTIISKSKVLPTVTVKHPEEHTHLDTVNSKRNGSFWNIDLDKNKTLLGCPSHNIMRTNSCFSLEDNPSKESRRDNRILSDKFDNGNAISPFFQDFQVRSTLINRSTEESRTILTIEQIKKFKNYPQQNLIKGKFKQLVEKFSIRNNEFHLVIMVEDGTGEIILKVHPDVICSFAGCTYSQLADYKQLFHRKDYGVLERIQCKFVQLNAVMEIKIQEGDDQFKLIKVYE